MTPERTPTTAVGILDEFARRTGLLPPEGPGSGGEETGASGAPAPSRRYLWTDAHAVCTWLGLHGALGEDRFLDLALRLVDRVHHVLGRHRPDDERSGWLSGLDDEEGARRPTVGGLRIGKPRPELESGAPPEPEGEWQRDGQYFHYLVRWMHALRRAAEHTGDRRYHRWAVELAEVATDGFVVEGAAGTGPRMVWKTSVDLSRPTVEAMGHHDPLDGLVTCAELQATTRRLSSASDRDPAAPDLAERIATFGAMCAGRSWTTADPLGTGGLLIDAWRWGRLLATGDAPDVAGPSARESARAFLERLASEARASVEAASRLASPGAPFGSRLAFREMGLSLGLHAAGRLAALLADEPALAGGGELAADVEWLAARASLATALEQSWLHPASRRAATWTEHEDINAVSLAASLAPSGYLDGGPALPG